MGNRGTRRCLGHQVSAQGLGQSADHGRDRRRTDWRLLLLSGRRREAVQSKPAGRCRGSAGSVDRAVGPGPARPCPPGARRGHVRHSRGSRTQPSVDRRSRGRSLRGPSLFCACRLDGNRSHARQLHSGAPTRARESVDRCCRHCCRKRRRPPAGVTLVRHWSLDRQLEGHWQSDSLPDDRWGSGVPRRRDAQRHARRQVTDSRIRLRSLAPIPSLCATR